MEKTIEIFKEELNLISDEQIRNLTISALDKVDVKFIEAPASSTGKYHPTYSLGYQGLVRHTKAVVYFAKLILSLEDGPFDAHTKDIIYAALILHDSCKYGVDGKRPFSTHEHPIEVVKLLSEDELNAKQMIWWDEINYLISSHMGQWNTNKRSSIVLPKPTSQAAHFVHHCDYLASRKEIHLNIFGEFNTSESTTPKVEDVPASDKQKNFVKSLVKKQQANPSYDGKYNDINYDTMTSKEASQIIGELK